MKNKLFLIIIAFILLFLFGCSEKTDQEILYDAQKKIMSLDSYTCTADITLYRDEKPTKYIAKHWFLAPDKYRVEIEAPENLKGKITIYDGKKAWICHPRIGQEWLMENFSASVDQKMFLGHFINDFISGENVKLSRETIDNKEYILMQTDIPGNHPYFNKEILWFDVKKYYPLRLQILDAENNERIDVKYFDFSYNESVDERIFKIK